jgi:hypothetical protein
LHRCYALAQTQIEPFDKRRVDLPATHRQDVPASSAYRVARYPFSRFYAVYDGDELLAVTVYKKGAEAVRDRLQAQEAQIAALMRGQRDQSEANPAQPGAVARLHTERASAKARQR